MNANDWLDGSGQNLLEQQGMLEEGAEYSHNINYIINPLTGAPILRDSEAGQLAVLAEQNVPPILNQNELNNFQNIHNGFVDAVDDAPDDGEAAYAPPQLVPPENLDEIEQNDPIPIPEGDAQNRAAVYVQEALGNVRTGIPLTGNIGTALALGAIQQLQRNGRLDLAALVPTQQQLMGGAMYGLYSYAPDRWRTWLQWGLGIGVGGVALGFSAVPIAITMIAVAGSQILLHQEEVLQITAEQQLAIEHLIAEQTGETIEDITDTIYDQCFNLMYSEMGLMSPAGYVETGDVKVDSPESLEITSEDYYSADSPDVDSPEVESPEEEPEQTEAPKRKKLGNTRKTKFTTTSALLTMPVTWISWELLEQYRITLRHNRLWFYLICLIFLIIMRKIKNKKKKKC